MIILIDAEKDLGQNSCFLIKSSDETKNRRNIPQHNKGCVRQIYSQHHTK
jgi:hypothetical protein